MSKLLWDNIQLQIAFTLYIILVALCLQIIQ